MRKLWLLLKYYYLWQPAIPLVATLGVLLFVLKVVFTNTSEAVTFALGMASFAFLFIIPFFSGSTALRHLIANPRLAMLPGFRVRAGVTHLVIAIAASVFLYANFLVFAPDEYSPLVMLRTFICLSAYAGFMQLILPSRYFATFISLAPIVFVMILMQFQGLVATLFLDANFTIALFLVSLAGWGWGFHLLATGNKFRPGRTTTLNDTEAWASYDGGLLTRLAIGNASTPQGTLLLGYPDNWWGIVLRVVYYFILTPLFTTGAMVLIGITREWDAPLPDSLIGLFLAISLFSGMFCIFVYGELVARARLVWLRYGTDRAAQWHLVDAYCLRYLLVYYLCGSLVALVACLLTDIYGVYLLHYLLIMFSFCCFNLYFSLLVRATRLPTLVLVIIIIISMVFLVAGIVRALWIDSPTFDLLVTVEALLLALGIAFRYRVKRLFAGIDWQQVKINKTPGRLALTQD